MSRGSLVMIGPFPPPVGGAALITDEVRRRVRDGGLQVTVLDTSVTTLAHARGATYHIRRLCRVAWLLGRLLMLSFRRRSYYLVPDGGMGVWYSALYATACTTRATHLFVHHHSSRYVKQSVPGMSLLVRRTGARAEHVFLTTGMADEFQARYGTVRYSVVSNAAFTAPQLPSSARAGALCLGHLSNLCAEKGFFDVVATFIAAREAGLDVTLDLAGPVLETKVSTVLADLLAEHPTRVFYRGPVSGQAKSRFFASIDVFLFPTHFRQEAAPRVIYEAAAAGAPTLSLEQGQIKELVAELRGETWPDSVEFSSRAVAWLRSAEGPVRSGRAELLERYGNLHAESQSSLASLVGRLIAAGSAMNA